MRIFDAGELVKPVSRPRLGVGVVLESGAAGCVVRWANMRACSYSTRQRPYFGTDYIDPDQIRKHSYVDLSSVPPLEALAAQAEYTQDWR